MLETKLLAGNTGYDLVVPTAYFLARQIQAGIFQPLDKAKMPNWNGLDPKLMTQAVPVRPGQRPCDDLHVGHHRARLQCRQDQGAHARRAGQFLAHAVRPRGGDASSRTAASTCWTPPTTCIPAALNFLGLNPNSTDPSRSGQGAGGPAQDPALHPQVPLERGHQRAGQRRHLPAQIYSGDAGIARTRAEEAKNGVKINYTIPEEGAQLWFDMMAMPTDAPDPDNAYAFMNYLLQPEVIAKTQRLRHLPERGAGLAPFMKQELRDDPKLYPPEDADDRLYVKKPYDQRSAAARHAHLADRHRGG